MCDNEGDIVCDENMLAVDSWVPDNVKDYFKLPDAVKRRIKALKNLQYKSLEIDLDFYLRLYELEHEFQAKHKEIFDKRSEIVQGKVEPTDSECEFAQDNIEEYKKMVEDVQSLTIEEESASPPVGVPNFWVKALKHDPDLAEMIMEHDEPILEHLIDMRCQLSPSSEPGFTIEFYFSPNEWFLNEKLTKSYFFDYEIPKDAPLSYSGPEIVACQGCAIDWNKGKDVTVKLEKKVQKHKNRPAEKRVVMKTVDEDSFFNYFNADKQSIYGENVDEEFLELDFKIGQFIRETLIPKAVLYFTGEAIDEDGIDSYAGDDDDSDDLSDEDDSEGDEPHLSKRTHRKPKSHGKMSNNNDECKQQ